MNATIDKVKKKLFGKELEDFKPIHNLFENKIGLEIGGPSKTFNSNNYLPIYKYAQKVDGCNFSNNTVWEGSIKEGVNYKYNKNKKIGYQFICEGDNLFPINDKAYDFILSSHSLEHFANPIKALVEWLRVIKTNGYLVLVLPDGRFTFDNKRSVTTFDHILKDYNDNTDERDLTHLDEILALHDYSMTPEISNVDSFKQRSLDNYNNRCLHHHVFDSSLLKNIFNHLGIEEVFCGFAEPHHLIMIGKKLVNVS